MDAKTQNLNRVSGPIATTLAFSHGQSIPSSAVDKGDQLREPSAQGFVQTSTRRNKDHFAYHMQVRSGHGSQ